MKKISQPSLQFHGYSMLTKRIIPCLDVKDGRVVKGINFVRLTDAGDPVENAKDMMQKVPLSSSYLTSPPPIKRESYTGLVARTAAEGLCP